MQLLAEIGNFFSRLGQSLLPPDACYRLSNRDEVRWGRKQDAPFERPVPESRILFQGSGKEMLADFAPSSH